jgi:hypothetical protein
MNHVDVILLTAHPEGREKGIPQSARHAIEWCVINVAKGMANEAG